MKNARGMILPILLIGGAVAGVFLLLKTREKMPAPLPSPEEEIPTPLPAVITPTKPAVVVPTTAKVGVAKVSNLEVSYIKV